MMNRIFLFLLCNALLFGQCMAQDGLRLEDAIIQVLENHPKLMVSDYRAQALAARMRQALQAPPDRINLSVENFAGTDETLWLRGVEATLSLSRTLELGNKAESRGELVQRELGLLENRKDIDRLNLLADTAQQFLHVAADQERLRLAEEALALVQVTEDAVRQRVQAGRTPATELHRVDIELANHALEVEHAEHELESSRVNLSTLWREREPGFAAVKADIFELDALPAFAQLTEQIDRNPEIIRHIRAEDLALARIKLMESRRQPDLDLSAGLRYLGGVNDVALMLTASMPLGSYSRARPGIEEAEALRQIEPLNLEQQRMELYATLFQIYQEMKHSVQAVDTLNSRVIPAAEQMLEDYEKGYQTGRYSLLELNQVQLLLRNARAQLLEMAVSYHSRKIEIDRLTGAQLTQW